MIATGWAASAGSADLCQRAQGAAPLPAEYPLPAAPALGGTRGMASDIEIQAREIIRMNERLNRIYAAATGQPVEKIAKDTDRDYWLSAEEAKDYGLVSRIIASQSEI